MAQTSKKRDDFVTTDQSNMFAYGLVTNQTVMKPYNSQQILRNFDITKGGSLLTREGLTSLFNVKDLINMDRLLLYKDYITSNAKEYVELDLILDNTTPLNTVGEYDLNYGSNVITISYKGNVITIPIYSTSTPFYYKDGSYFIEYSLTGNVFKIIDISSDIQVVLSEVISANDEDYIQTTVAMRGFIETFVVMLKNEIQLYTRYSTLDLTSDNIIEQGNLYYNGVILDLNDSNIDIDTLKKYITIESNDDRIYIKTPNDFYGTHYRNDNDYGIVLILDDLLSDDSIERYKPNSSEVTVNGYNILAPLPESEVDNIQGITNNIVGIIVQGKDSDNRTQPFKTQKALGLRAIMQYVLEGDLDKFSYKWSYDYIGSSYTNNIGFNKTEGDVIIVEETRNQNSEFIPKTPGMYRIYCTVDYDDATLEDIKRYAFIDIQVENDIQTYNSKDELFYYNAIKHSQIFKKFKEYFVIGGAVQSTGYSSYIMISAPNNPSYFPTNYTIKLPGDVIIVDFVQYKDLLLIFTNDGIYKLTGDVPYSVAQLSSDKSLNAFEYTKVMDTMSFHKPGQYIVTPNNIIVYSNSIYKLWFNASSVMLSEDLGYIIEDLLPNNGFDYLSYIDDYIWLVKGSSVIVMQPKDKTSNSYGVVYTTYEFNSFLPRDVYKSLNETIVVLENGHVCYMDKTMRGYDLGLPFLSDVKTNNNYFGNRYFNKGFKKFFYDILPIYIEDKSKIDEWSFINCKDQEELDDVEEINKCCLTTLVENEIPPEETINFSLNIWLDDKQLINSIYNEYIDQYGDDPALRRVFKQNAQILYQPEMISNKKNFVTYGQNTLTKIYGEDLVDLEQVDQHSYIGGVRLRGTYKSASMFMRFTKPVQINSIGWDFKVKSSNNDYSGNNFKYSNRIRRK